MRESYYSQLFNPVFNRKTSPYTYSGKPKLSIDDWYKEWCKRTKRNGGVLIGSSIKELLLDIRNDQSKIK